MTSLTPLFPRRPVPALEVSTVGGGTWSLAGQNPEHFTMVVFYRGLHCPICSRYMADLEQKLGEFESRGVSVVAISSDDAERAAQAKADWRLAKLTLGYGLDLDTARAWGLYISSGRGKTSTGVEEPALFSEPGLFMVRPDGTLYFGAVQTMPFARPGFREILGAIDFVVKADYPARGEVRDHHHPEAA
ncbi:MAG: AhpC/TSA family protein [Rhodospirillales bacterium]|nr:AhpC/TSA family protein [Rhodospirillales bacterium]